MILSSYWCSITTYFFKTLKFPRIIERKIKKKIYWKIQDKERIIHRLVLSA